MTDQGHLLRYRLQCRAAHRALEQGSQPTGLTASGHLSCLPPGGLQCAQPVSHTLPSATVTPRGQLERGRSARAADQSLDLRRRRHQVPVLVALALLGTDQHRPVRRGSLR